MKHEKSAGGRFRSAVKEERPLQVVGAINAYAARLAERTGFKALYVSGWASAPWTTCSPMSDV
jgi:methylisocitrate lyase